MNRWLAIGVVGAVLLAACGDDDGDEAAGSVEEYCALVGEIGDELPTDEQLEDIVAAAPEEIASDIEAVADAIEADGEDAFSDPEVIEMFGPIEAFEAENCGDADGGADEGAQGASDADRYCAVIDEVGDELPTDEQFDEILAAAPDEIASELQVVIDGVKANGEEAFSDPDVAAAYGPIEAFESENCGSDDDEIAGTSDEIDPDAQRVDVAASEYAFDFETPDAGAVSFVMANEGDEVHEMVLARFVGDATFEEAMASEDPEAEGLVETAGFAGAVSPGAESVLTVEDLTPGRYAMVCFIPVDGQSHAEKGMVSEFTVG